MEKLSYCADFVQRQHRDAYLHALFVPLPAREAVLALYALDCELAQVRHAVSEEMLGHIRFAWWEEGLEALYEGKEPRGQPVLQALAPLITDGLLSEVLLMPLVETYRAHFPEAPHNADALLDKAAGSLIETLCPEALSGWRRAGRIIRRHRTHHPTSWNGWLAFKLLLAGR